MLESGLLLEVFRWNLGDCTNDGVSHRHDSILLVDPSLPRGAFHSDAWPVVRIVRGPNNTIRLVPDEVKDRWVMFGGNFAYSSDSRFIELLNKLGHSNAPLKIFDRVEEK